MGGLFSRTPEPEPRPVYTQPTPQIQYQRRLPEYNYDNDAHQFRTRPRVLQNQWLLEQQSGHRSSVRSGGNSAAFQAKLVKIVLNRSLLYRLNPDYEPFNVRYTLLDEYDYEYQEIKNMVTNKRRFKIDRIEKVDNPVLRKAYELKKQAKELPFPHMEEKRLFHGTKHANVNEICKYNFDWRRGVRHKFGKGVSFSPNSTYAANYSDKNRYDKLMIVALVLIGNSCMGWENMEIPPEYFDTTQKGDDGIVIVKYEDNEFYPAFKITYHLLP